MNSTVLFVDDDNDFLDSLRDGLVAKRPDYTVLTANDVPRAKEMLSAGDVDVLVTDLKMPGEGGFDLLTYMVGSHPDTPSLVMTAYGTPELERQAEELGALRLLSKPVDITDLQKQIDKTLAAANSGASLQGISVPGFLQLLAMERSSSVVHLTAAGKEGTISFVEGRLADAETGSLRGDEAVMEIAMWQTPKINLKKATVTPKQTVKGEVAHLMMEAARRHDELSKAGSEHAAKLDEILERLGELEGFLGAAVMDSTGAVLAQLSTDARDMAGAAPSVWTVVRPALETADGTGSGPVEFVYIEGRDSHLLCRFVTAAASKTDLFEDRSAVWCVVLALTPQTKAGMGKLRLNAAAEDAAALMPATSPGGGAGSRTPARADPSGAWPSVKPDLP